MTDSKIEAVGSDMSTNNISNDSDVLLMEMGTGVEDGHSDKGVLQLFKFTVCYF